MPRFDNIRAEALDFGARLEKTPSCFIFKACPTVDPCARCLKITKARQEEDPAWLPSKALRHLAWNNYRLPFPEMKNPDVLPAVDEQVPAAPAPVAATGPRAVAKKEELSVLQQPLDQATFDEDLLQAARVKTLRDVAKVDLQNLLACVSSDPRPAFAALPTSIGDTWVKPGASAYKTFEGLCLAAKAQLSVHIPVSKQTKRLEQVLPCDFPCCRYVAKTAAEQEIHRLCCHGLLVAEKAQADVGNIVVVPLEGYSVAGCPPVLPKKRPRKEFVDVQKGEDAAPAPLQDDEILVGDGVGDGADDLDVPVAKGPRIMTGQRTSEDFKVCMPEFCAVSWIGLKHDQMVRFSWQARYDHTDPTARDLMPDDLLESLPKEFRQKTKDVSYKQDQTAEGQREALGSVLAWAWEKHTHLTGVERPDHAYPS